MRKIKFWFCLAAIFLISMFGQAPESTATTIFTMEEQSGLDALLKEEGYKGTFQTSTNMVDTVNSSGWTYDTTNKLYKNATGTTGQTANVDFNAESQYVQQEWTKTNQSAGFVSATNGSTTISIASGTWPTNSAASRITFDSGSNWYDVASRDSSAQLTLAANYVGATATTLDWTMRMSEFASGTVKLNETTGSGPDSNTKLLLHMNGTNGSTTFTDASPSAHGNATANGNASVSTAQSEFGGASLALDGTGDYLSYADSADWRLGGGSGDFTIDLWIRFAATGVNTTFCSQQSGTSGWMFAMTGSGTELNFYQYGDGTVAAVSWSPSANTWYHVALVRSGNAWKFFVNGAQQGNDATSSVSVGDFAHDFKIGSSGAFGDFNGSIDEFRLSNVARWTSNFTPPSSEYGPSNVINEYISVAQAYANRIDTSAWSDINSLSRTETLNSQTVYYWLIDNAASSFGASTTAKVWSTGNVWRNIARNNAGTWQYNNDGGATAAESWSNATTNDMFFAVSQAISAQTGNRMTGSNMTAIADANLTAPATSEVFGITLYSTNNAQNPAVDNIAVNYDTSSSTLDLRTKSFTVTSSPASLYAYVVDRQIAGTPSYYVTRDGGAGSPTWVPVTLTPVVNLADGRTVRRGALDMTGAPTGTDIRVKITAPAGSSYEISAVGLESRQ